jgi:hypothetical protein
VAEADQTVIAMGGAGEYQNVCRPGDVRAPHLLQVGIESEIGGGVDDPRRPTKEVLPRMEFSQ